MSSFENNSQPVDLGDEHIETNHSKCSLPDYVPLMSSKEKLKCRKVKAVLRYHQPNPNKDIEKYAHHLLFSFFLFRDEQELKSRSISGSYFERFQEPDVLEMVTRNKTSMEPFIELVDQALLNLRNNLIDNINDILPDKDVAEGAVILEDVSLPN